METRAIAVGDRFGDVQVRELRNTDGRYKCECEYGHITYCRGNILLEPRKFFCFVCVPSLLKQNLSGKTFGSVTFNAPLGNDELNNKVVWHARCACGTDFKINGREIEHFLGDNFSCGCVPIEQSPRPYLAGRVYGKLTVLSCNPKFQRNPHLSWLCQCECGRKVVRTRESLWTGKSLNCGSHKCSGRPIPPYRAPTDPDFGERVKMVYRALCLSNEDARASYQDSIRQPLLSTWNETAERLEKSPQQKREQSRRAELRSAEHSVQNVSYQT